MADEKRTVIVDVRVNNEQALAALVDYQKAIDKTKAEQKAFEEVIKETKKELEKNTITEEEAAEKINEARLGIVKAQEARKGYNTLLRQTSKEVQNNITEQTRLEGSLTSLRAQLSNLTAEYDNLSREQRNSDAGKAKMKEINDVTKELKGAEEETQRFYRNVGNYAGALKDVFTPIFPELTKVRTALSFVSEAILQGKAGLVEVADGFSTGIEDAKLFAGAQRTVAVATTTAKAAWQLFSKVLLASGIGLIVASVASLVAWLTRSQEGVEFVSKAMASLNAVIDVVLDRFTRFGSAIANVFSGKWKAAGEDLKATFVGIGKEIAEDAKQAWKLEEATIALDKQEAVLNARRAASKVEIAELKRISDDVTKSEEERIAAATKAIDIERREAEEAKRLGALRIANMLGYTEVTEEVQRTLDELSAGTIDVDHAIKNLGLSESTLKDFQELTNMFVTFKQKEQEFAQMEVEGNNKLNSIRKSASDARKAMLDKEVQEARAAIDMEIYLMAEGFDKQRAEEEERYRRQVEDLKERLATEEDLTVNARKSIHRQIELAEQLHFQKMGEIQALADAAELARLQAHEEMIRAMGKKMIEDSEADFAKLEADLAAEDAAADERRRLQWDNKIMEARNRGAETASIEMEMAQERLNSLHQMEGESNEAFRARQLQAEGEYLQARKRVMDANLATMSNFAGSMSQLSQAIGEDTAAGTAIAKAAGLIQVGINTGVAISNIIAAITAQPGFTFMKIAQIATGVLTIVANMATAIKYIKGEKTPGSGSPTISTGATSSAPKSSIPTVTEQLAKQSGNLGANVPSVSAPYSAAAQEQSATAEAMRSAVEGVQVVASWIEGEAVGKRVEFVESLGDA